MESTHVLIHSLLPIHQSPNATQTQLTACHSTDKAETPNRHIKDQQRVYSQADAVAHHAGAAQDADASSQRPCDKDNVDRNPRDSWQPERAQQGGNDQRKERVADDADRLEEGTRSHGQTSKIPNPRREESTYMFPPSSLICKVTMASPIQTMENTPEKTSDD